MITKGEDRDELHAALSLASVGRLPIALERLDGLLERALASDNNQWTSLVARNAAIVADQAGDLPKAERYLRAALGACAEEPQLHFALGDLYRRMGNSELSSRAFMQCFKLAIAVNDNTSLELLEKVGFKRPA